MTTPNGQPTRIAPLIDAHLDPEGFLTGELTRLGHPRPAAWAEMYHRFFTMAVDKMNTSGEWRRQCVNKILHIHLAECNDPRTQSMRFLLVDEGSFDEWKTLISENVAPFMVKNNLPL